MAVGVMRPAALVLALLAATAAAAPVQKCVWALGVCNASPGYLMSTMESLKPTTPQTEGMLRVFALEATCHASLEKKDCTLISFCKWDAAQSPKCAANLEPMTEALEEMPTMTGCPGSLSEDIAVCGGAKTYDMCFDMPAKCGWLEADDIPVATGLPRAGRRKRFVRRRLSAGLSSPMMRSNTTADYTTEELVMGPNSTPLAGCLPAELAQLAKKRDIPELEALVELMDARDPKVYGTCEETASKMMMKCGEAEERKACADAGICEWDADTKECYISQAPMMAALLGDKSRTAEAARTCRDILTAGPCNGAGTVEFDLRRARHLLPNPAAVARALSGQKSVRLQQ